MTSRSQLFLVGGVFLAGCSGAPPAEPDATGFSPAVLVSGAVTGGATPMFAVNSSGKRFLSWVTTIPGDSATSLQFRITDPAGLTRTSLLRDPLGGIEPHGEAPPIVAVGRPGEVFALYTVGKDVGERFPSSALRFARSDDDGVTWSDPVSVNDGAVFGSQNFHSLLAGANGDVYAAWLSSAEGRSGVWLRSSADNGESWGNVRPIYLGPTCPCCRTGLALAPDGTLYASWRKIFDGDIRDVVVAASHDGGVTWGEPIRPRVDDWKFPGCPHAGPALRVATDGSVHIAWWTGKAGEAGVWYAKSVDQGATWSAQPIAVADAALPAHVQLALDKNGTVIVAYDDGRGPLPVVKIRASSDGGRNFGDPILLSEAGVAATFPVMALAGDQLTVAWTQVADSSYRQMAAERSRMKEPEMRMPLPRVGQQEVWRREGPIEMLVP